jgi:hypothetical protein
VHFYVLTLILKTFFPRSSKMTIAGFLSTFIHCILAPLSRVIFSSFMTMLAALTLRTIWLSVGIFDSQNINRETLLVASQLLSSWLAASPPSYYSYFILHSILTHFNQKKLKWEQHHQKHIEHTDLNLN